MVVACVMGWEQGEAGRSAEGIKFSGWAWRDRRAGGPFLGATIIIAIDDDDGHIDSQAPLQFSSEERIHHPFSGMVLYTHLLPSQLQRANVSTTRPPCVLCRFLPQARPRSVRAECPFAIRGGGRALAPLKGRSSSCQVYLALSTHDASILRRLSWQTMSKNVEEATEEVQTVRRRNRMTSC